MALHISPWLLLLLTALTASVIRTSATDTGEDTDDSFVGTERALKKHCTSMCSLCTSYMCTPQCLALALRPKIVLAKSCKDILDRADEGTLKDGVYTIGVGGNETQVYCDMLRDGGGWTLITATKTSHGWTKDTVYGRNIASPSLAHDYSILRLADSIKKNAKGKTFEYRIEANGRGLFGGIWKAPVSYTFTSTNKLQTDVTLTKKFSSWKYTSDGIEKRMPWITLQHGSALLTTDGTGGWWGCLMMKNKASSGNRKEFNLGPWMNPEAKKLNECFYWLREN